VTGNATVAGSTEVRGVTLQHERGGAGPTLVWGHGLTSSMAREDELPLVDWPTARCGLDVVRYDARGHGSSGSTPDPASYHWRSLAEDQLALADALGIGEYVAGGASMGCATALHATILSPERIQALVLVIPPTAWETRAAQREVYELGAALVERGAVDQLVEAARARPLPGALADPGGWLDSYERMVRSSDPVRLAHVLRGAATADLPDPALIARIDVPVLILDWTGDPVHPVATADRLAELLPHAERATAANPADLARWTGVLVDFVVRCRGSSPAAPGY
jgi:3-oxoadipate enol-lactonase